MKRNSLPNDKPAVEKTINIELPSGRLKLRLALVIALIVLAVAAFGLGINSALSTEPGLTEISALSGEMNAGSSFTFYYYLGWDGADASDERRAVRSVYTEAATAALGLFDSGIDAGDVNGLYHLSRHVNEPVAVDAALYSALEQLEESGTRYHYLAPPLRAVRRAHRLYERRGGRAVRPAARRGPGRVLLRRCRIRLRPRGRGHRAARRRGGAAERL